jgi:peptidoglycan/xylan/chitin deacetylase (PgdA/CDA1 family)
MSGIPILTYHEISERPHPLYARFTVTPTRFDQHMAWLARGGYTTLGLQDLLAARSGGKLPSKPIVITFDDGCRDGVSTATTVLTRYQFTATFFLVTGKLGGVSDWSPLAARVRLPLIDWPTAERLLHAGFSIGSHTVSHPRLTEISVEQCRHELRRSRVDLTERLGEDIVHLSYPFGSLDDQTKAAAADAGYRTACQMGGALVSPSHNLLALPRITIPGNTSFADFKLRVRTGRGTAEMLRSVSVRRLTRPIGALSARVVARWHR